MCDRGTDTGMEQLRSFATLRMTAWGEGGEKRTGLKTRHYGAEKRGPSTAQADRFAGAKREEKVGLLRSG